MVVNQYQCPRCNYKSPKRVWMSRHFQRKYSCTNRNSLILTPEIMHAVLTDRIYHKPPNPLDMQNLTKRKAIPKKVKDLVWDQYIGEDINKSLCFCCKKTVIKIIEFSCGHVISVHDGGSSTIENLRPVCSGCNQSMGTTNMFTFMQTYFPNIEINSDMPVNPSTLNCLEN